MLASLAIGVAAFVAMEPVTWAVHRFVMHGPGWFLHRSHHAPRGGRLQANDAFPVAFASIVGTALAIGFNVDGFSWLVPLGVGVTGYGGAYALVHDGYIHRRLPVGHRRSATLDALARAHDVHHRTACEPFGMLAPYVPRAARRRSVAGATAAS